MKGVFKKTGLFLLSAAGIMLILIGTYTLFSGQEEPIPTPSGSNVSIRSQEIEAAEDASPMREDMLEEALRCVVGISSADTSQGISKKTQWYMGSGVLASSDGYIITNHHVIGARPERIVVTLHSGETLEGKTVWSDSSLDLAVVKIDGEGYPYCTLGNAKRVRVGESVVAIGNPLSMQFERTVTAGIISAVGRSISIENDEGEMGYMEDLIQTDAAINSGNSGGPLLNEAGEVVGINTIKVSSAEGMGFAVPINVCVPVIERLRSVGQFRTPYLGLYAYTPAAARYLGASGDIREGLFVAKIDTEGPAFAAGIRYGDVITAINGEKVNTMLSLREELYKRQSGEEITVEFIRNTGTRRVGVMLSSMK